MKIANLATVQGAMAKILTVGVLAGAVVMAAPQKANAQQVYARGGYGYAQDGFYDRARIEQFRRHEEFERRQAWIREQYLRRERQERWEHGPFDHNRFDHDRFDRDRFNRGGYR